MRRDIVLVTLVVALAGCRRETRRFDDPHAMGPYEGNAYAISQGQQLFSAMNCVGCHSHGGGGMGPPLMDDKWLYGSEPSDIFETIVGGRPNGMPAWRARLSDQQVWQLVAYVRSLSGLEPRDAESARDEHMSVRPPPNRMKVLPPIAQKEAP